jgi:hypothetical protein
MVAEEMLKIVKILILLLKSKKVIFKVSFKTIQSPGWCWSWSRSRRSKSSLRLREAGTKEIFSAPPPHCLFFDRNDAPYLYCSLEDDDMKSNGGRRESTET